jgi:hypothetical protein
VAKVDASWQKKAFRYALNQLLSHVAYAEAAQPTPAIPAQIYLRYE